MIAGGDGHGKNLNEYQKEELVAYEVATGNQVVLKDGPWWKRNVNVMGFSSAAIVHDAAFTSDGKLVWTDRLGWWDIDSGKSIKKGWMERVSALSGAQSSLNSCNKAFSPDGRFFVVPGDRTPTVLEMGTGQRVTTISGFKGAYATQKSVIVDLAFSPDGTMLLTISEDGQMIVWNLKHDKTGWPKSRQL